jgi:imidazolonepropionase-like amidohydrolase
MRGIANENLPNLGRGTICGRKWWRGLAEQKKTLRQSLASLATATSPLRGGVLAAVILLATPAFAQTIAITGGRVVIGDGSAPIDDGIVVITNGRVTAAGKGVAIPPGAERIDARGKWVTPGIVSGFTRLGLAGVDAVDDTNDSVGRNALFGAGLDVSDGINPDVEAIGVSRAAGVTRAIVSPEAGGALFGGQGAIIDTGADFAPVMKARAFQFVEFGEAGARRAGGSRPALYAVFRNALSEARDLAAGVRKDDSLIKRVDAQALIPVLNGTTKLFIHAESAVDISGVLDLKRQYPALDIVLVGASEGWRVASRIAAAKVPVLASALNDLPGSFEMIGATQSNIGRMKTAGVTVAIGMIDDNDTRQAMHVLQYAGNLVALTKVPGASGLSWDDAFAAITSKPSEIAGVGAEIGSLKAGRRGDVVIWDGDPLEVTSGVESVWIDGVKQPLSNRQTRLRDRYLKPAPDWLPKAYDR